jgi:peptidoglycan lytic transglycosylase G
VTEGDQPTRGQGRNATRLLTGVLIAILVVTAAAGWFLVDQRRGLDEPLAVARDGFEYMLPAGASLNRVTQDLAASGVLANPRALVIYARWYGRAGAIKTGEYRIDPGTTAITLLDQLVAGRVVQHALTLVEGWTFEQMMTAVAADQRLEHTLTGLAPDEIMARLGFAGVHPEGRFLPDTYYFTRGTSDVAFLRRAYGAMSDFLAGAWAGREQGLPFKTPEEALILASIVEKETGEAGERPRIAGVFVKRLRKGMRLETDPTVIYGLGDAFDGRLRRRDLRDDTPYNTYVRKGLPPTPIAMPGAAAIQAVLRPLVDSALFFVAKGDGSHYFSATYEEHRRAVERYQKRRHRSSGG